MSAVAALSLSLSLSLVFLSGLILSSESFGQVTIKEKVTISPRDTDQEVGTSESGRPSLRFAILDSDHSQASLQKTTTTSCSADDPNYVPCEDRFVGIQFFFCENPCNPPPDDWTVDVTLQLHPFPDTTFTWDDGTLEPKVLPVNSSGNTDTLWYWSHTWWGVFYLDVVLRDKNGQILLTGSTARIPSDSDQDGIADAWELDSLNGGSLSLPDTNGTPVADDAGWDWEKTTQFTNHHHGDGITKLQEYQGVMIGTEHHRLSPAVKEVFIDTMEAEHAAWVAQQLETQLFLKAYLVAGVIGPPGSQSPRFPGTNQLRWLGENEATFANYRNYVKVKDDGRFRKHPRVNVDSLRNGIIVAAGRYWTGLRVTDPACTSNPYCAPQDTINGIQYGLTQSPIYTITKGEKAAYSRIFDATINGLLDVSINSIPEATPLHYFFYPIADGRDTAWVSVYNGTDIDGGGFGLVNPLDLLSVAPPNDSVDAHSGGQDVSDIQRMTTLHELGHALGMGPGDTHDNTKPSPMVVGHGPYNVSIFRSQDKQEFRLK